MPAKALPATELKTERFYYDRVNSDGSNGTNGTCSPSSGNKYDCRTGSESVGYCLQHEGTSEDQAKLNDYYKWFDTYDINYLAKGLPGESGEYKTVVVRSLNGIDKTITIGRGGSAAALNLGQNGADGSATKFGSILTANGGAGGAGSQIAEISAHLPTYDGTAFNYQKLQRCFTTTELDDDADCQSWKSSPSSLRYYQNTSGETASTPTKKAVGGMFSFVLASFGVSNDNTVKDLMQYSGIGGRGGGVEHFCWAGQYILTFEGHKLVKSSVFWEDKIPSDVNASAIPSGQKIPVGCSTAYRNIPAGPGFDGALIITW